MIWCLYATMLILYGAHVFDLPWMLMLAFILYVIAENRYSCLKERIEKLENKLYIKGTKHMTKIEKSDQNKEV